MNIRDIDLNLLAVLEALLREKNVTRAARRVGLSQPAVSHALARLRAVLGDPLLVRSASGMVPTKRAEELVTPVREALAAVERALAPAAKFDPVSSRLKVTIATTDYAELVLLPRLCRELSRQAPGMRVEVRTSRDRTPVGELEEGIFDLAIGFFPNPPETLFRQQLFKEDFVCAVRAGHPDVKGKLTLKQFTSLKHVLISPFGGMSGPLDETLARQKLSRDVVVATPHFMVAPLVVATTDYCITLPRRVGETLAPQFRLQLHEPPVEVAGFAITQLWHARANEDSGMRWLRHLVAAVASGKGDDVHS